jgi:hypothetical protein
VNEHLEAGLLGSWRIDGLPNQQGFYGREVAPVLAKGSDRRVFVIISDAFRYEIAQELASLLNGKYRLYAALSAQIGVLTWPGFPRTSANCNRTAINRN